MRSVETKKIIWQTLPNKSEATGNPDFLLFGGFLIPNLSIKQKDFKNLFEYHNQWPSRLSNYSKRSMGTDCWRKIDMTKFRKKLHFISPVCHYEIQQSKLMMKSNFSQFRMIILTELKKKSMSIGLFWEIERYLNINIFWNFATASKQWTYLLLLKF